MKSCYKCNNGNPPKWIKGICDVCKLLKKDETEKDVYYCNTCQANICKQCEKKYASRIIAAVIKKIQQLVK